MKKVFLALDNISKEEIVEILESNRALVPNIKIGLELYCKYGNQLIIDIKNKYEVNIFLDLKLFDIPNTVASAIRSISHLDIDFLTIHLSGGPAMIQAALNARDTHCPKLKILGVSILTSFDNEEVKLIYNNEMSFTLSNFADIASISKLDGIICSASDLALFSKYHFLKVCPGIRFSGDEAFDQKRIQDPKQAFKNGADFLVMGRSILKDTSILKNTNFWKEIYSSQ